MSLLVWFCAAKYRLKSPPIVMRHYFKLPILNEEFIIGNLETPQFKLKKKKRVNNFSRGSENS